MFTKCQEGRLEDKKIYGEFPNSPNNSNLIISKISIMEQIRTVEAEIDALKKKKRNLEEQEKSLHHYDYEDGYWCTDEKKSEGYKQEIVDIEEKIKSRQQLVQTLTRSNQITNRGSQSSSSTQNNQLQRENQEIKQILLRLERKVDQLQGQVNRLVNQQRQEQSQAQIQVPPKNFSGKRW